MDSTIDYSLEDRLALAEEKLGHVFQNRALLLEALSHSSYANEKALYSSRANTVNNERLEFLGDAVIGLIVGERLMEVFPTAAEGKLSRWRSNLVSRKTLADLAAATGMGDWLLLGRGERRTGGAEKRSILAGVFEALIGALYLDVGLLKAREFLVKVYEPLIQETASGQQFSRKHTDQKTYLQEVTQSRFKSTPVYRVVAAHGLEHEKTFHVELEVAGRVIASGEGRSKKEAEQQAATKALEILEEQGEFFKRDTHFESEKTQ